MFSGTPTLCLKSRNLAESRRFYEALGMTVVEEVPGVRVVLRRGSFRLALMAFLDENWLNFRGGDVLAVRAHLENHGFPVGAEPERYERGARGADADGVCWSTRDADGNVVFFDTHSRDRGAGFEFEPIGFVRSPRTALTDDDWGSVRARIELADAFGPESLDGLEAFSHVEVIFVFHRVGDDEVERGARHPRGNPAWPKVGIFAQRGKNRPNRLGSTIARIAARSGRSLEVEGLDAIDGTPVVDLKPVMQEFLPREPVRQPAWSRELMCEYWRRDEGSR
jgi:tRNA-Thr(GGU) m(6)t(6)A37 methyltransferase TsaA